MDKNPAKVRVTLHVAGPASYAHFVALHLPEKRRREYRAAVEGAEYIRALSMRLTPLDKVPAILVRLRKAGFSVDASPELRRALQKRNACDWLDSEALKERIARIDDDLFKLTSSRMHPYQRTGALWLARQMGALLADEMGLGKALSASENVVTEDGYRAIGDLKVGDYVTGSDGEPTRVVGVYPQGVREVFRVLFSNGRSVCCDLDHLWIAYEQEELLRIDTPPCFSDREPETLRSLMDMGLFRADGQARWVVPVLREGQRDGDLVLRDEKGDGLTRRFATLVGVEYVGPRECVCIKVEAEDELFAVNDFIVTHNTLEILVALPAKAAVLVCCPAVAKGDWRAEIKLWRPQMKSEVLEGRNSFRWPKPGEILITNYDILPNIHDTEGVAGRVCNGKLPPKPCSGCAERIAFSGSMVTTIRTGHEEGCSGFLPPKDCPGCHPLLKRVPHGVVLVGDEAQNLKNAKSLRGLRWSAIRDAVRGAAGRVWLATGTPLENTPPELWNVLAAAGVAEAAFGSQNQFKASFHAKKVQVARGIFTTEWGLPGDDVKERLQRVMLRRMIRDVQPELPSITRGTHIVKLDTRTLRSIDEFLRTSKKTIAEIVELVEMQEVGFEFMSSVRAALASAKIPAMLEIVKDFEEKDVPLVVFSAHRAPIDVLANRPGWLVISGAEDSEQKRRAADQFQNGYYVDPKAVLGKLRIIKDKAKTDVKGKEVKGILRRVDTKGRVLYPRGVAIVIASGSVSLTLTRACHQLFVDRAWKPTANQQAEARTVRLGQTNTTFSKTLVADHPLDERVSEVLIRKTKLISLSIDAAADGSDAPLLTEQELDKHLTEMQEAIACGHAIRRMARSEAEKTAVENLHTLSFRYRSDERIAGELAEEASEVGLSEAQWALAIRIAERGLAEAMIEQERIEKEKAEREKEALLALPVDDEDEDAVEEHEDEALDETPLEEEGMPLVEHVPRGRRRPSRWGNRRRG